MQGKLTNVIIAALGIVLTFACSYLLVKLGGIFYGLIPFGLLCIVLGVYLFKNPFLGFLMIIFFLPFERVPTYQLGGANIKINTILGLLTLVTWFLATLFNGKKWKIQPNAIAIPLILFIFAMAISVTQAFDAGRAYQTFAFTLFTIALSVMTVNMIPDISSLKKTIYVLFFSGLVTGLFGLFQFGGDVVGLPRSITLLKFGYDSKVFGFPRIQAFSMEPLYLANYLLIPLSLCFAYYLSRVKLIDQQADRGNFLLKIMNSWWLLALMIILLVNFVLTVSRGGYLGLAATILVFVIFYYKKLVTWRNFAIILALMVVGLTVSFALSKGQTRAPKAFVNQVLLKDRIKGSESIQGRLMGFDKAIEAYQHNPVFGVGMGNYGPWLWGFTSTIPKGGWPIVNNEYLELLAETGLVGLIAYSLIFVVLLIRTFMALKVAADPFLRSTLIGLFAALVGIMVQYASFSTLYIVHIWIVIGLLVATQTLILKGTKSDIIKL